MQALKRCGKDEGMSAYRDRKKIQGVIFQLNRAKPNDEQNEAYAILCGKQYAAYMLNRQTGLKIRKIIRSVIMAAIAVSTLVYIVYILNGYQEEQKVALWLTALMAFLTALCFVLSRIANKRSNLLINMYQDCNNQLECATMEFQQRTDSGAQKERVSRYIAVINACLDKEIQTTKNGTKRAQTEKKESEDKGTGGVFALLKRIMT